jgi:hypothetical protein
MTCCGRLGWASLAFAKKLGVNDGDAAWLIDPMARTPVGKLEAALSALGHTIGIEVRAKRVA